MNTNIQKFEISFLMLTYISIQIGFVLLKKFRLYNDKLPLRINQGYKNIKKDKKKKLQILLVNKVFFYNTFV